MKILLYCQHVWGVGHLFRIMEICKALATHDVVLAVGGPRFEIPIPSNVCIVRLPAMHMDADYKTLRVAGDAQSLDTVKAERRDALQRLYVEEQPDVLLIELYPFGRRSFRFELDPLLEGIRDGELPRAKVVCSLRDILVAKKDAARYEQDVVTRLNTCFDAVLVHADQRLVPLEETFSRTADIRIPLTYTGFVVPKPAQSARKRLRLQMGLKSDDILIVASAGGGRSGAPLLQGVIETIRYMQLDANHHVKMFTGPFMPQTEFDRLVALAEDAVQVERFSDDFLSLLAAADLSISMGGYNTSMNLLATGVPALVWPYPGDREQGLRARRLSVLGVLKVLTEADFRPLRLASMIRQMLRQRMIAATRIDMDGAAETARRLTELVAH